VVIALLMAALSACSGRLICEYQTEDERFQKLITETVNGLQEENETVQKP